MALADARYGDLDIASDLVVSVLSVVNMSAAAVAIDRPACAVCAAWRFPCERCMADAVICNELIAAWNHGLLTSGGLSSMLGSIQGQPYKERKAIRLTADEVSILAMFRGEPVTLGERLSERSKEALYAM